MNNETAKLKGQFVTTQLRAALDGLTAAERLRVTRSEKAMSLFVESAMKGARVVQVEIKHYNRSDLDKLRRRDPLRGEGHAYAGLSETAPWARRPVPARHVCRTCSGFSDDLVHE